MFAEGRGRRVNRWCPLSATNNYFANAAKSYDIVIIMFWHRYQYLFIILCRAIEGIGSWGTVYCRTVALLSFNPHTPPHPHREAQVWIERCYSIFEVFREIKSRSFVIFITIICIKFDNTKSFFEIRKFIISKNRRLFKK